MVKIIIYCLHWFYALLSWIFIGSEMNIFVNSHTHKSCIDIFLQVHVENLIH